MKTLVSLRMVSLFSGAGGLDLGFKELGFEIVFANDVRRPPADTYSHNFGLRMVECAPNREHAAVAGEVLVCDVGLVDFSGIERLGVDVVAGGHPCQDFSIVKGPGRRGLEVRRGRLYIHFVRALYQLQPKVFVFENVPGLASLGKGLAYKIILEDFNKLNPRWSGDADAVRMGKGASKPVEGYEIVFSGTVDFSALGAPQRRERLIIIGVRKDLVKGERELEGLRKAVAEILKPKGLFAKYPLTPIEVFEGRPLPELQEEYEEAVKKWEGVWSEVGTPKAWEWRREVWSRLSFDVVKDYLLSNNLEQYTDQELEEAWREHRAVLEELGYWGRRVCSEPLPDGTCEEPGEGGEVAERMKHIPFGENHEFVRGTKWQVEGKGISLIYRRLHPLKPSYTIVAYGGGGTHGYHYDRNRATLMLREKARLQTFPDAFLFKGRKTEIRAQIGEAVPPLAAKRIAGAVLELLKSTY